jgi:hypothetical protein
MPAFKKGSKKRTTRPIIKESNTKSATGEDWIYRSSLCDSIKGNKCRKSLSESLTLAFQIVTPIS